MSYREFNKISNREKKFIFQEIAGEIKLPDYSIEKDWWVVQTLRLIFQLDIAPYLSFKGGTSLSKAWNLINRFSEDIDLSLTREYLGFPSSLISKTQVRKLREASHKFVTEEFYQKLQDAFVDSGIENLHFEFENLGDKDQDPVSILIFYPQVVEHPPYLLPRIKVEIGSRSMKEPFTKRSFSSLVATQFPNQPYADSPIKIPCINPERTYLEKLFLLHEEFQRPKEKIRVERLSRHLYDIWKIASSEYKPKGHDPKLITDIIAHRERFSAMRGVDYASLYPPNLNPIPSDEYLKSWAEDYRKMRESMIYGESPSFIDLIAAVAKAAQEYNDLILPAVKEADQEN